MQPWTLSRMTQPGKASWVFSSTITKMFLLIHALSFYYTDFYFNIVIFLGEKCVCYTVVFMLSFYDIHVQWTVTFQLFLCRVPWWWKRSLQPCLLWDLLLVICFWFQYLLLKSSSEYRRRHGQQIRSVIQSPTVSTDGPELHFVCCAAEQYHSQHSLIFQKVESASFALQTRVKIMTPGRSWEQQSGWTGNMTQNRCFRVLLTERIFPHQLDEVSPWNNMPSSLPMISHCGGWTWEVLWMLFVQ